MKYTTTKPELRATVDLYLDACIKSFYESIPFATHQLESKSLNLEYYKRHNIETILRLRRKRTIDAIALQYFTKVDPVNAKAWAHYADDEMLHDVLFAADLAKVGVPKDEIYSTEPMLATKLLTGYLQYGLEYEGTPLALITSVYFVEYVTTRTQPMWLDNLEKVLGKERIKGQRAHVGTDLNDQHDDFVWQVLESLVKDEADEQRMLGHMADIARLWQLYFIELYTLTVDPDASQELPPPVQMPAMATSAS